MEYTYKIVVGDYSKDGHNQYDDFIVKANLPAKKIRNAYNDFVKILKFGLSGKNAILEEYEDGNISKDKLDQLKEAGICFDNFTSVEEDDGSLSMAPEDVATLYMEMARVLEPKLKYEFINEKFETLIEGIGYGCYQ